MIGAGRAALLRSVVTAPAPTLSAIRETNVVGYAKGPAAGGMAFTLVGTELTGATSVTFGGTAATSFTVVSATTITGVTPALSAGDHNVTVMTPGGSATLTNGFEALASGSQANVRELVVAPGEQGILGNTGAGGDGGRGGEAKYRTGLTYSVASRAFVAPTSVALANTTFNGQTASIYAGGAPGYGAPLGGGGAAPFDGLVTTDIDGTSKNYGRGGLGGSFEDDAGGTGSWDAPNYVGTASGFGAGGAGSFARSSSGPAGTGSFGGSGVAMVAYPLAGSRYMTGGTKSVVTISGVLFVLHVMTGTGNHVNT